MRMATIPITLVKDRSIVEIDLMTVENAHTEVITEGRNLSMEEKHAHSPRTMETLTSVTMTIILIIVMRSRTAATIDHMPAKNAPFGIVNAPLHLSLRRETETLVTGLTIRTRGLMIVKRNHLTVEKDLITVEKDQRDPTQATKEDHQGRLPRSNPNWQQKT
jgi:hypothetical protein